MFALPIAVQMSNNMITDHDVRTSLSAEVPAIARELQLIDDRSEIFKSISCLAAHTKDMLAGHRTDEVLRCFHAAHELLAEGSQAVRFAVINLYIDPVSRLLEHSFAPTPEVRTEFIRDFGTEYYQLLYAKTV